MMLAVQMLAIYNICVTVASVALMQRREKVCTNIGKSFSSAREEICCINWIDNFRM